MVSSRGVRCQLRQQAAPIPNTKADSKVNESSANKGLKERINLAIANVTLSASPFDIAWVAMVPSQTSHAIPCFPNCLEWILQNQKLDGSWSLNENYKYFVKDDISSTLACVISLKRWNIGQEFMQRGLEFIGRHSSFLIDDRQYSPIGFNVIFSEMLQHSKQLGLFIPISEDVVSRIYAMRDIELKRFDGERSKTTPFQWISYIGYTSKGTDPIHYYDEVRKRYQKNNGSLFNSPSATAAMLIHLQDMKAMNYLHNVVHTYRGAVPVVHPSNTCARLCMVDSLQKLGIARHYSDYIQSVLDETYRAWFQNEEEELHTEIFTYALAFRLLRTHGYDVSFENFNAEDMDELLSYKNNSYPQTTTALELYKASQLEICQNDGSLKSLKSWSIDFLRQIVSKSTGPNVYEKHLIEEVEYNLNFPFYECLERLENRRNIENHTINSVQCLKSSFMYHNIIGLDMLKFAIEDFKLSQFIYQKELYILKRWFKEKKLDHLASNGLNGLVYSYLTSVSGTIPMEFYDARIALVKNGALTTILDDFFDDASSIEEQDNLVDLCQRWNSNYKNQCCSERVYILFDAIYTTVEELSAKASLIHGYNVTSHIIEVWVDLVNAMRQEMEWKYKKTTPTMEEYMDNGYISFALGPVILPALYFVGESLSWDIIRSQECQQLFESLSIYGRLMNDIAGFKREKKEGKITSIGLTMLQDHDINSEEDAMRELLNIIEENRNKLSKLVFQNSGSVMPRGCKKVFWNVYRLLFKFYDKIDGLRSNSPMLYLNLIVNEPISNCC